MIKVGILILTLKTAYYLVNPYLLYSFNFEIVPNQIPFEFLEFQL